MQRVPVQRATTFLRSIKNAVILRVPMQRATPWLNEERRHIAGPSATGSFIMQKCMCNIFRVQSFIRFSSHRNEYITHTDSVRHNNIFIFEDAGRLVLKQINSLFLT